MFFVHRLHGAYMLQAFNVGTGPIVRPFHEAYMKKLILVFAAAATLAFGALAQPNDVNPPRPDEPTRPYGNSGWTPDMAYGQPTPGVSPRERERAQREQREREQIRAREQERERVRAREVDRQREVERQREAERQRQAERQREVDRQREREARARMRDENRYRDRDRYSDRERQRDRDRDRDGVPNRFDNFPDNPNRR